MTKQQGNYYAELAALDVSEHVEKKGKFSYLSWTWAVDQLRRYDDKARWDVKRFGPDQLPYLKTDCGYFVEVEVTVNGITLSQIHPVLDNNNRPIEKPNAFQINTSIQRGLVKSIALHGLGLYIYAGEDIPYSGDEVADSEPKPATAAAKRSQNDTTVAKLAEQQKKLEEDVVNQIKTAYAELSPDGDLAGFEQFYEGQIKKKVKPADILAWLKQKLSERKEPVSQA